MHKKKNSWGIENGEVVQEQWPQSFLE